MNRKKIFSRSVAALLTMIFAFTMGFLPVSASASNLNTNNGFYLATEEVPDGVLTYAQNNIYKFLLARSEEENVNFSSITMGSPFTFGSNTYESTDVFFFPVFSDGQIIYTFRVYMDETGYTGILSRYMAKELNNYRYSTSQSEPLYIYMEAGNVLARLKDNVTLLEKRHPGYEPSASVANATPITDNKVVTDISTPIMFAESPLTRASASKTLTLDMKETQSDQQWCAAFVMSSILRYKRKIHMKKVIYIMLCLFLIFSFSSCKKSETNKNGTDSGAYKPSLMYDNVVYSLSSEKSENFIVDKDSLEYVGTIKDTISGTTLPTQNFQASGNSELLNCDIYSSKDYPDRLFVFCEGNHYYVYDKE